MLSTDLEQLVSNLRALGRPIPDLVPGVDKSTVQAALGEDVPPPVVAWFAWCNGVTSTRGQIQDEISLIPGYYPLSLTEALSITDDYSGDLSLPGN